MYPRKYVPGFGIVALIIAAGAAGCASAARPVAWVIESTPGPAKSIGPDWTSELTDGSPLQPDTDIVVAKNQAASILAPAHGVLLRMGDPKGPTRLRVSD